MSRTTLALRLMLVTGIAFMPQLASGDLFDQARQAITVTPYQGDTSGMSIRGGANLQTGQTGNQTLFRTQASVGGSCGSFNFRASMTEAFETLPEVFEQLLANVIQEIPMLVL
jgi:hypothetical protein